MKKQTESFMEAYQGWDNTRVKFPKRLNEFLDIIESGRVSKELKAKYDIKNEFEYVDRCKDLYLDLESDSRWDVLVNIDFDEYKILLTNPRMSEQMRTNLEAEIKVQFNHRLYPIPELAYIYYLGEGGGGMYLDNIEEQEDGTRIATYKYDLDKVIGHDNAIETYFDTIEQTFTDKCMIWE